MLSQRLGQTTRNARLARAFPLLFLTAACAAEVALICAANQGSFGYTLDDPYIHLALAENIARGHYGVNLGEASAPSSSIVWPFLLAPFARTALAEFAPLAINFCASALTVLLVDRLLRDLFAPTDARDAWGCALAVTAFILCTNVIGVLFTGMEHALQVTCVVASLWAVRCEQREGRLPKWAILTLGMLPSVRYEAFVLAAPLALYLARRGQLRAAAWVGALMVALPGAFSIFLLSRGLGALPSSVEAKANLSASLFERASQIVHRGWGDPHVLVFFLLVLLFLLLAVLRRATRERELALVLAVATSGQLYIGNFGWFDRYEIYLYSAQLLVLVWLLVEPMRALGSAKLVRAALLALVSLFVVSGSYVARALQTPAAARNMHEQQAQMHRFVVTFYPHPVAVHDLGLVSFRNDAYVLDLNGLASREVLSARRVAPERVWRERLSNAHGVRLAMVYDVDPEEIPLSWIRLGTLQLAGPLVTAFAAEVAFFATRPAFADELRPLLERFRAGLPAGVKFTAVASEAPLELRIGS